MKIYFPILLFFIGNSVAFNVREYQIAGEEGFFNIFIYLKIIFVLIAFILEIKNYKIVFKFRNEHKKQLFVIEIFILLAFLSLIVSNNFNTTLYRSLEIFILYYLIISLFNRNQLVNDKIYILQKLLLYFSVIIAINHFFLARQFGYSYISLEYWTTVVRANAGTMVASILFFVTIKIPQKKFRKYSILIISLILIVLFKSTTSILILLLILTINFSKNEIIQYTLIIGGTILGYFFWIDIANIFVRFDPGKSYEAFLTFTGRTQLWEVALAGISNQLLLGIGYGNERNFLIDIPNFWNAGNIHNGYLSSLFGLGIFGSLTLLIILIKGYLNIRKLKNIKNTYFVLLGVYIFLLINNLTIAGIGSQANISWGIFFFIYLISITLTQKKD